jgi:hypothetical protein
VEVALAIVLLLAVVWFVTAPLRRAPGTGEAEEAAAEARLADLEARKEAKYREIRDAQLDHAQGKLSDPDFRRLDDELRRQAIEILRELDSARAGG